MPRHRPVGGCGSTQRTSCECDYRNSVAQQIEKFKSVACFKLWDMVGIDNRSDVTYHKTFLRHINQQDNITIERKVHAFTSVSRGTA
jgi:hypothetical protein